MDTRPASIKTSSFHSKVYHANPIRQWRGDYFRRGRRIFPHKETVCCFPQPGFREWRVEDLFQTIRGDELYVQTVQVGWESGCVHGVEHGSGVFAVGRNSSGIIYLSFDIGRGKVHRKTDHTLISAQRSQRCPFRRLCRRKSIRDLYPSD